MPKPIPFPPRHLGTQRAEFRAEFRAAANNEQQQSQRAADHVAAALRYRHTINAIRENSLAEGRQQMHGVALKRGFLAGFVTGILCTFLASGIVVGGMAQWLLDLVNR